jgi:hypothetical protein
MRRKTYVLWKKILTRLAIAACVIGGLYVYLRTGVFTIQTYAITGAPADHLGELMTGLHYIDETRLYKVLPGNRVISYHDDDIRTLIKETLPNTKDISIYPSGLHTLSIRLTKHSPLFAVSATHAISTEGVIYQEINPIDDLPQITLATSSAISAPELASIAELISDIDAVLYDVKYISVDDYNDVHLYDDKLSTSIITSAGADMGKVWSNILSAIDTDPLKSKLANKGEHLEYLDTRFGNKVFYKFTNRQATDIIPPHATSTATSTPVQH